MGVEAIAEIVSRTGLAGLLVIGFLFVIYRLGTLSITKYFDKITPLQERQTRAMEDLAGTAKEMRGDIGRQMNLLGISVRALWEEWEARKTPAGANG